MAVNQELFKQVHDIITPNPELLDMPSWEAQGTACGTTRCVTGWGIHLITGEPVYANLIGTKHSEATLALARQHGVEISEDGAFADLELLGLAIFGLDQEGDSALFYSGEITASVVVELFAEGKEAEAREQLHSYH